MVGLPWGQCQGWSIVPMCCTTWEIAATTESVERTSEHYEQRASPSSKRRTDVICRRLSGVPIMMLILHARIANMARALEQRTICPAGRSWRRWRSSSRSAGGLSILL